MRKSKLFAIMLFLTLVSSMLAKEFGKEDYRIYKSTDGKEISLKKMAKELSKYDVIFFGEWHDDALLHQLEADILPLLDKKTDLAISMEMFERDVQSILNDFLDGKISEEDFLKKSRAWGNYPTDYKPIIEYAKKKKLDVLAANVPRRYAALVSKQGGDALNQLSEDEKPFVARELKVLDNQYKKQFMETMSSNMGRKTAMGMGKMLDNIYAAQCIKDDTMAESIYDYLMQNPKKTVIHYNGDFHSESHLGTANKLHLLNPKLKIAVITPVIVADDAEIKYDPEAKDLGDYLIFAKRFPAEKEKKVETPKMFKNISNTITEHNINLEIDPYNKSLKGFDEITLANEISTKDTIFLFSALKISDVQINGKTAKYELINDEDDYIGIIFPKNYKSNKLKISYAGEIYFPLQGRELNQTHDGTKGIISAAENEGIYLPGANWYPLLGEGLADFNITVSCPEEFLLLTSGKETKKTKNGMTVYNWKSELPVDHLYLVGNKFELKSKVVNGVELRTYLLKEDAKFADTYLAKIENYLHDYSKLFGEYPFSSFSVVENFFASGFGMPNYTLLAKEIVKMPFITLSPGVIAHEFCHNWWGNSVYVDYENGNWCEALTVFSSNYYQNILNNELDKAAEWRKKAVLENNLLPVEKRFPLKEFVYQHNDDEAVIGYQKGAMLFVSLFQEFGEEKFFEAVRDFYKTNKGKVASWVDVKTIFEKHNPKPKQFSMEETFDFWLNSTQLIGLAFEDVSYSDGKISGKIKKDVPINLLVPIRINFENSKLEKEVFMDEDLKSFMFQVEETPISIEIDPNAYLMKRISQQSMPYNLNRTLNDSPLVILPEKGEMKQRLQMVASMLAGSGYDITVKSADEVTDEDIRNNSLLIFGEYENNSVYKKISYPKGFDFSDNSIKINNQEILSEKGSAIISFASKENNEKNISIYIWNSPEAVSSFRKMFHYLNDSWQVFDLDIKENAALESGQIFPVGKNDLLYRF